MAIDVSKENQTINELRQGPSSLVQTDTKYPLAGNRLEVTQVSSCHLNWLSTTSGSQMMQPGSSLIGGSGGGHLLDAQPGWMDKECLSVTPTLQPGSGTGINEF
jgi:hypothetical protein